MSRNNNNTKSNTSLFQAATNFWRGTDKYKELSGKKERETGSGIKIMHTDRYKRTGHNASSSYLIRSLQEEETHLTGGRNRTGSRTRKLQLRDVTANSISKVPLDTLLTEHKHRRGASQSSDQVYSLPKGGQSNRPSHSRRSSQQFNPVPFIKREVTLT